MRTKGGGGVKNPENFADVLYVWSPSSSQIWSSYLVRHRNISPGYLVDTNPWGDTKLNFSQVRYHYICHFCWVLERNGFRAHTYIGLTPLELKPFDQLPYIATLVHNAISKSSTANNKPIACYNFPDYYQEICLYTKSYLIYPSIFGGLFFYCPDNWDHKGYKIVSKSKQESSEKL